MCKIYKNEKRDNSEYLDSPDAILRKKFALKRETFTSKSEVVIFFEKQNRRGALDNLS